MKLLVTYAQAHYGANGVGSMRPAMDVVETHDTSGWTVNDAFRLAAEQVYSDGISSRGVWVTPSAILSISPARPHTTVSAIVGFET